MKGIIWYTKEIVIRARERGRLFPLPEINYCTVGDEVGMGVVTQML